MNQASVKALRSLSGKTVAVTGSTGGIGRQLCRHLGRLGAKLILMDRNRDRSVSFGEELISEFPDIKVSYITADLEDIESVKAGTEALKNLCLDCIIHNAGAYSIPRHKCKNGLDNVFQINFASPYYITRELMPHLRERGGRVVVVGSIAHRYSVSDPCDVDFSTRTKSSLVYGNAKRYLMFAMYELFRNEKDVSLAITHPGITFTNITAHYPPLIFAIIKNPMKVIFMKPDKASLSVLEGVFDTTEYGEWIGPRLFDVWGMPRKKELSRLDKDECRRIFGEAERIYADMKDYEI